VTSRSVAWISSGWLQLGLRLFIGGIFLFSAVSKLPHHTEFEGIVKDYDMLPDALATAYANALPWVELLVGVYLVLGILVKPSAALAILMGVSFFVANVSAIVRGDDHCGSCFGETFTLPVWQALTIDIFLLAAAVVLILARSSDPAFTLDRFISKSSASKAPVNLKR